MDTLDDKALMPAPMDLEEQPSVRDRESLPASQEDTQSIGNVPPFR